MLYKVVIKIGWQHHPTLQVTGKEKRISWLSNFTCGKWIQRPNSLKGREDIITYVSCRNISMKTEDLDANYIKWWVFYKCHLKPLKPSEISFARYFIYVSSSCDGLLCLTLIKATSATLPSLCGSNQPLHPSSSRSCAVLWSCFFLSAKAATSVSLAFPLSVSLVISLLDRVAFVLFTFWVA